MDIITALNWEQNDSGFSARGYVVDRVERSAASWRLRCASGSQWPLGLLHAESESVHPSARSAKARAVHLEVVRIRRIRVTRHFIVAALVGAVSVMSFVAVTSAPTETALNWFAAAIVSMVLALREFAHGAALVFGEGWDCRYEVPDLTRLDYLVGRAVFGHATEDGDERTEDRVTVVAAPSVHSAPTLLRSRGP